MDAKNSTEVHSKMNSSKFNYHTFLIKLTIIP